VIYTYEAGGWKALDTKVVGNKATAMVDHFSTFVLFAAPEVKPTETPTATPTATPEPPGFEAVFAIAGLLSIAYLVLRKRR